MTSTALSRYRPIRLRDSTLLLTPTDIANHLACRHLTQLDHARIEGRLDVELRQDPRIATAGGSPRCTDWTPRAHWRARRAHAQVRTWLAHEDINDVMLATSLVPEGFLALPPVH